MHNFNVYFNSGFYLHDSMHDPIVKKNLKLAAKVKAEKVKHVYRFMLSEFGVHWSKNKNVKCFVGNTVRSIRKGDVIESIDEKKFFLVTNGEFKEINLKL